MGERIRVQRKKASEYDTWQHTSADQTGDDAGAASLVRPALSSGGQALDSDTRTFMESRFGHDFSQVRVHTDDQAAASAEAINANAYTVGPDIVFGAGQYTPGTSEGQHLLAHELTHVVQQSSGPLSGGTVNDDTTISEPADSYEQVADQVAQQVTAPQESSAPVAAATAVAPAAAAPGIQRQADEEEVPLEEMALEEMPAEEDMAAAEAMPAEEMPLEEEEEA